MRNFIRIVGCYFPFSELQPHETVTFPGAGNIAASAIQRTSKNRYNVYVIYDNHACCLGFSSTRAACDWLQNEYDEYGTLIKKSPTWGRFEG